MCRKFDATRGWLALLLLLAAAGCEPDMANQPRVEPLEASDFFEDDTASRHPPVGTVPRGYLDVDAHFYAGRINGELATTFPRPVEEAMLARGQERYLIFCAPCHDRAGTGRGMIVQRGFPPPPSFHTDRLRELPVGHFFDVMTNGFGRMYDYADQLTPEDRWAVAAYIRVLQMSQYAPREALTNADLERLEAAVSP
jgi:mono/diheme cytochrome c family protein